MKTMVNVFVEGKQSLDVWSEVNLGNSKTNVIKITLNDMEMTLHFPTAQKLQMFLDDLEMSLHELAESFTAKEVQYL